jgi:hypothetical protein
VETTFHPALQNRQENQEESGNNLPPGAADGERAAKFVANKEESQEAKRERKRKGSRQGLTGAGYGRGSPWAGIGMHPPAATTVRS